jgi:hypothetical protein
LMRLGLPAGQSHGAIIWAARVKSAVIPAGIAGIQSQGGESTRWRRSSIKHLRNLHVTVHGTGFRHPCRNDEPFSFMRLPWAYPPLAIYH